MKNRIVHRIKNDDRFTLIAGLLDHGTRARQVALAGYFLHAGLAIHGRPRHKDSTLIAPVLWEVWSIHPHHVLCLTHGSENRLAHQLVIEWGVEMIKTH